MSVFWYERHLLPENQGIMPTKRKVVTKEELVRALNHAASEIREMGCTCALEEDIHGDGCVGHMIALRYEAIARGEDPD